MESVIIGLILAIMLGRLKFTFPEIRKAVLQMDQNVLTELMVKQFLEFVPTAEEVSHFLI